MKDYKQHNLEQELKSTGANKAERGQLLSIAANLSSLNNIKLESDDQPRQTLHLLKFVKPVGFTVSGLAAGMFLIIVSQAALPTSWLYPVQKFSDTAAVDFHPQYRASIMMKRAQQVNQLVANHAGSKQVLATLADYNSEAHTYTTMPHTNYAAFEYCRSNLRQAAVAASPSVRQAISSSLQSLETT